MVYCGTLHSWIPKYLSKASILWKLSFLNIPRSVRRSLSTLTCGGKVWNHLLKSRLPPLASIFQIRHPGRISESFLRLLMPFLRIVLFSVLKLSSASHLNKRSLTCLIIGKSEFCVGGVCCWYLEVWCVWTWDLQQDFLWYKTLDLLVELSKVSEISSFRRWSSFLMGIPLCWTKSQNGEELSESCFLVFPSIISEDVTGWRFMYWILSDECWQYFLRDPPLWQPRLSIGLLLVFKSDFSRFERSNEIWLRLLHDEHGFFKDLCS